MPASIDDVALSLLPIQRRRRIADHLRAGRSAGDVLDQLLREGPPRPGLTRERLHSRAIRALERATALGITAIEWSDPVYPPLLAAIVDAPPVLWLRGSIAALGPPAVAIVGSRAGSEYALAVAERLAADLTTSGYVVVSGLARGVDSAAHRGALAGPGSTIAVLGSGADVIYPKEHERLATDIAAAGAIVSELAPGTPPQPHFFPLRNRIISGLSCAVVIVEAGEKSGSLITARAALEQGRDVLAVPGGVLTGRNRGGHALLRDGAKIVETADDILEEVEGVGRSKCGSGVQRRADRSAEDVVLACVPVGEACDLDAIAQRSGLAVQRLLPRLLELELKGLIERAGVGRYVRVDRTC